VGNGNEDISSEEHFENLKISTGSYLIIIIIIIITFIFHRQTIDVSKQI
jgi:hypothetical protein